MLRRIKLEQDQRLTETLLARSGGITRDIINTAAAIVDDIKNRGDEALAEYTLRFDGVVLDSIIVTPDEIDAAYENVDEKLVESLEYAAARIADFHQRQLQEDWIVTDDDGVVLGQKITPIRRVGIYVPGGIAVYPSSVLMNALPAIVAGVTEIAMVVPPAQDGTVPANILVAADIAGITEIYKAGGAQAVGALAYGTETIPAVDKIVGPGNAYVAAAKKHVMGDVGIDMIAGPSEVLVLADKTSDPRLVAIDLMAQAEHDPLAATYLVTTSPKLADQVEDWLTTLLQRTQRPEITSASLNDNSVCVLCTNREQACDVSNSIAPEHLEIVMDSPHDLLDLITNAGAIFIGPWTPESVGDYVAGPNHVLPTGGTARFSSPLNVEDFTKKSSIIAYTEAALARDRTSIEAIANSEGLWSHEHAVTYRFEKEV